MRRACWRSLAVISSTGRCVAIPGASRLSSCTVVPGRGVRRGIGGCSILLHTAWCCLTRVTELILFGVTTGRREDFDWLFRDGLGAFFPEEWERRRSALPVADRDGDTVEAYCRLLQDSDPAIRAPQGDVMPDQQLMRAVLELDLAAYADVARVLEENLDRLGGERR